MPPVSTDMLPVARTSRRRWMILIIACALVLATGGAAYYASTRQDERPTAITGVNLVPLTAADLDKLSTQLAVQVARDAGVKLVAKDYTQLKPGEGGWLGISDIYWDGIWSHEVALDSGARTVLGTTIRGGQIVLIMRNAKGLRAVILDVPCKSILQQTDKQRPASTTTFPVDRYATPYCPLYVTATEH